MATVLDLFDYMHQVLRSVINSESSGCNERAEVGCIITEKIVLIKPEA